MQKKITRFTEGRKDIPGNSNFDTSDSNRPEGMSEGIYDRPAADISGRDKFSFFDAMQSHVRGNHRGDHDRVTRQENDLDGWGEKSVGRNNRRTDPNIIRNIVKTGLIRNHNEDDSGVTRQETDLDGWEGADGGRNNRHADPNFFRNIVDRSLQRNRKDQTSGATKQETDLDGWEGTYSICFPA
jgi:hypothetical protein